MSHFSYDFYTPEVYEHFSNPHHAGQLDNPTAVGEVGNIVCGDLMKIYLKIDKNSNGQPFIADISFETYGCAAAIATSSMTTDLAINQTLTDALKITKDQVVKGLSHLPPQKIHCSILAVDALDEAIYNYYVQEKMPIPTELQKRHQQIAKQQAILSQRYEAWTKQGRYVSEEEGEGEE